VTSTIISLVKSNAVFICASHLHQIPELLSKHYKIKNNSKPGDIYKIGKIRCYHLSVEYDKKNDQLIFDRLLKRGLGSKVYGIDVSKYVIHDKEFIENANKIQNMLLDIPNELLQTKKSKYNKQLYVDECFMCHTRKHLDVHHINFQKFYDENNFSKNKPYLGKNSVQNLVVMCRDCHQLLHKNKFQIIGYKKSSNNGNILQVKK